MAINIIFVDDEKEDLSSFMRNVIGLEDIHYHFFGDDCDGAYEYVLSNPVDCAFLDIHISASDGVALAKKMLKAKPDLKIAFITGYVNDEQALKDAFGKSLIAFAYKPFGKQTFLNCLAKLSQSGDKMKRVQIHCFNKFEVFVNGIPLVFHSKKSEELLALMVAYSDSTLEMNHVISLLWPNYDLDLAKRLYRDAVFRLRVTLKEAEIEGLCEFSRGKCALNASLANCDYWDMLKEKNPSQNPDAFLRQYPWSSHIRERIHELKR